MFTFIKFLFTKNIESVIADFTKKVSDLEALERQHLEEAFNHAKDAATSEEARVVAGAKAALANSISAKIRSILGQ